MKLYIYLYFLCTSINSILIPYRPSQELPPELPSPHTNPSKCYSLKNTYSIECLHYNNLFCSGIVKNYTQNCCNFIT